MSHLRLSQSERHQGGGGEEQEQGREEHADLEHQELAHVLRQASENGRTKRTQRSGVGMTQPGLEEHAEIVASVFIENNRNTFDPCNPLSNKTRVRNSSPLSNKTRVRNRMLVVVVWRMAKTTYHGVLPGCLAKDPTQETQRVRSVSSTKKKGMTGALMPPLTPSQHVLAYLRGFDELGRVVEVKQLVVVDAVQEAAAAVQRDEPVHHNGVVAHEILHQSLVTATAGAARTGGGGMSAGEVFSSLLNRSPATTETEGRILY